MTEVAGLLGTTGVLPVVVIDQAAHASALASTLGSAGLTTIEVTLRTPSALDALRAMAEDPAVVVGAGTVVRPGQVEAAVVAGARFVVSPGFSAAVVKECAAMRVPCIPGVATATEIQSALDHGLDVLKFFPAESAGGTGALKAWSAPFAQARFVPTGGITAGNLTSYLMLPSVLAVGGSWMVAADLVSSGAFDRIGALSREAVALAHGAREGRDR